MSIELDLTPILVSIVAAIGIIFTSKTILNHTGSNSKVLKNKIKDHEEYEKYLKKMVTTYKNKANSMEKGPAIEGELSELESLIPDLVSQFGDYAPKWLQPLLKDQEAQKWILDYVGKNPDKAKQFLGKMVGKKQGKKDENPNEEAVMSV